jgi:Protein of unknown function (DUF3467)
MPEDDSPQSINMQMQLPETMELGVFADFANVWHTPNTFVLDFLAVKVPIHPAVDPGTGAAIEGAPGILETRVAARVRIPPEQIFPLVAILQQQGSQWLAEQGRSEPPADWTSGPLV